jgi:hypothetical protein
MEMSVDPARPLWTVILPDGRAYFLAGDSEAEVRARAEKLCGPPGLPPGTVFRPPPRLGIRS